MRATSESTARVWALLVIGFLGLGSGCVPTVSISGGVDPGPGRDARPEAQADLGDGGSGADATDAADATDEADTTDAEAASDGPPMTPDMGGPCISVAPESLDFGELFVGEGRSESVVFESRCADPITLSVAAPQPRGAFLVRGELQQEHVLEGPRDTAEMTYTFVPQDGGRFESVVVVQTTDPQTPEIRIPLAGEGRVGCVSFRPDGLYFGTVPPSSSATLSSTLRSDCPGPVTFTRVSFGQAPEFEVDIFDAGFVLEPGDTYEIDVTFEPRDQRMVLSFVTLETDLPELDRISLQFLGQGG